MPEGNSGPAIRGTLAPVHRAVERMPLMRVIDLIYSVLPPLRKAVYRTWYHHMSKLDKAAEANFANYGFAHLEGDPPEPRLTVAEEPDRLCIQLYNHVAGAIPLSGLDVLEIGSGRGGGASYVARYLGPRSVTGLDVNTKAVEFCRRHHRAAGLRFRNGDGEALPFEDGTFDVVINVESSHCYGSMRRFLREAARVLRPHGKFLFTDFRRCHEMPTLRRLLSESEFDVEAERNITRNVFQALEQDSDRKAALILKRVPPLLQSAFRQFAATKGTPTYEAFRTGAWEYFSFVLRRNAYRPEPQSAT